MAETNPSRSEAPHPDLKPVIETKGKAPLEDPKPLIETNCEAPSKDLKPLHQEGPSNLKKVVFKVDWPNERAKKKAMNALSGLQGADTISIDMKYKKLTVIGNFDPVDVVIVLRKLCPTDILSVGPAKGESDKNKGEPQKRRSDKNKGEPKKDEQKKDEVAELVKAYQAYNPYMNQYPYVKNPEEDPNACLIS